MQPLKTNYSNMKQIHFVLFFGLLIACGKRGKEPVKTLEIDDIIAVNTEQILTGNSVLPIEASGLVASTNEARLSFKTGGIIEKIYVKEGQNVAKGQLLATLNLTEINASVQQATEAVHKAERDLKRITNLYADSVSTLEQVQNLTTVLSVAKQNLQIASYNRNYSTIHAPNAGTIIKKIMNEGELAGPGNPVFFMNASGTNDWVLKVGLSDKDWARLKLGDRSEIKMDAFPDENFTGFLSNLGQGADPNSGLYQVELKLNTAGKKIASGLFGISKIFPKITKIEPSISINALVEGNNKMGFMYTIVSEKAKKIPIEIDHIAEGRVYLKNYPAEITTVITNGSAYLVDGTKVKMAK
jgi:membrane fusion protein, multidrug efflux system